MILRPFLSNRPTVYLLLIPFIAIFYYLNFQFGFQKLTPEVNLGLWGKSTLFGGWVGSVIAGIVILIHAIQINYLFNQHEFLEKNSFAPSLFYVLFMTLSHSFLQFDGVLVLHICWIQIIRIFLTLKTGEDGRKAAFNTALLFGVSITFVPPAAGLILFFWIGFWVTKSFSIREWLLMHLGVLIPVSNALVFWWFSGHHIGADILDKKENIYYSDWIYYSTAIISIAMFLVSLIGVQTRLRKSSIRFKYITRTLNYILFGFLLFGVAEIIFYQQIEWFSLIFIPLSLFFNLAFIHQFWKQVASSLFYIALLIAVGKFFVN